jgi:hypothetical protein
MNGADTRVFRPQSQHEARKLRLSEDKVMLAFNGYLGNYYDAIPLLQAIARLPDELKRKVLLLIGGFAGASYAKKFVRVASARASRYGISYSILNARTSLAK